LEKPVRVDQPVARTPRAADDAGQINLRRQRADRVGTEDLTWHAMLIL
jgi:hypothetical protein